jgi:hypothetical protein
MLPLVAWAAAVVIVFGVSFERLGGLQAPLASLNAAAHVTFRISRVRLMVGVCRRLCLWVGVRMSSGMRGQRFHASLLGTVFCRCQSLVRLEALWV